MTRVLRVLPAARRDLLDHAAFIAQDSSTMGHRFLAAAEATFEKLARMPAMGVHRQYAGASLEELRMFPVGDFPKYLVFYRPIGQSIEIVRVLHAARDLASILGSATE